MRYWIISHAYIYYRTFDQHFSEVRNVSLQETSRFQSICIYSRHGVLLACSVTGEQLSDRFQTIKDQYRRAIRKNNTSGEGPVSSWTIQILCSPHDISIINCHSYCFILFLRWHHWEVVIPTQSYWSMEVPFFPQGNFAKITLTVWNGILIMCHHLSAGESEKK